MCLFSFLIYLFVVVVKVFFYLFIFVSCSFISFFSLLLFYFIIFIFFFFVLFSVYLFPVGIWCQNDVVSTSMRHHHVVSTMIRRHFTTCVRWVVVIVLLLFYLFVLLLFSYLLLLLFVSDCLFVCLFYILLSNRLFDFLHHCKFKFYMNFIRTIKFLFSSTAHVNSFINCYYHFSLRRKHINTIKSKNDIYLQNTYKIVNNGSHILIHIFLYPHSFISFCKYFILIHIYIFIIIIKNGTP